MPAWLVALLPSLAQQVLPYVVPALLAGAGWLTHRYVKNQKLADALEHAEGAAATAVRVVAQTYVDDLVERSKDGELTETDKQEAKKRAIQAALAQIPTEYLDILRTVFPNGALDAFVGNLVESALHQLKLEKVQSVIQLAGGATAAHDFEDIPGLTRGKK